MHPVQKHLFATDFRDLAGSEITGTLALSETLINLGVADLLQQLQRSPATVDASPQAGPGAAPAAAVPDLKALLRQLAVEQLQIRMKEGKLLVDIAARLNEPA